MPTRLGNDLGLEPIGVILKRILPQIKGLAVALRTLPPRLRPGTSADCVRLPGGRRSLSKSLPWRESDCIPSRARRSR